jgi:hypothetical protein
MTYSGLYKYLNVFETATSHCIVSIAGNGGQSSSHFPKLHEISAGPQYRFDLAAAQH